MNIVANYFAVITTSTSAVTFETKACTSLIQCLYSLTPKVFFR